MQFKILKNQNLVQGVSEASFGSMRGKRGDKNAARFLKALGHKANIKNLIWAEQVFGSDIHICREKDGGKTIKKVDGLLTNHPDQILAIVSADCVPILLFDPKNRVVAALHGSRNSLVKGIIKKTIKKMILNFNSEPKQILVGIGPHIRKRHYWLKEKIYQKIKKTKFRKYFILKKEKVYLDLTRLAFDELLSAGIRRKNIEDCDICTFCQSKKYFSARKKETNPGTYKEKTPRFASFIGLRTPQVLEFSPKNFNFLIQKVVKSVRKGEVIVSPTDTVYGVVTDATNKKAVEKVFKIKKRKLKKPIPIFVRDIRMAKKLAQIDKKQGKFLKEAWPGKATVILKRPRLRRGFGGRRKIYGLDKKTIALRIPNYRFLNILLKKINRPLTGTSANVSGKPASTKIKEIISQFKNQKHQPDLIIDAGNLSRSRPSRVIDLTGKKPKILRK